MNIERKQIRSNPDPDNEQPWYELKVTDGNLVVKTDADGGLKTDLSGESHEIGVIDIPDPEPSDGDKVYAVTEDGQFISYATGTNVVREMGVGIRAHLGWYHASTDTIEILDFVQ